MDEFSIFHPGTEHEVSNIIETLKPKKCFGFDGMRCGIIRKSATSIAESPKPVLVA